MSADGPDYDALEAVVAAATPGPWEVQACCPGNLHYEIGDGLGLVAADSQDIADADLIVAAVNALPDLLARARERDELRASHDDLTGRLGFGPGFQEPKADNDTIIAFYEQESRDASEWRESQQWRGECALNGHRDDEDCYEHDPMLILHNAIDERDRLRDGIEALADEWRVATEIAERTCRFCGKGIVQVEPFRLYSHMDMLAQHLHHASDESFCDGSPDSRRATPNTFEPRNAPSNLRTLLDQTANDGSTT